MPLVRVEVRNEYRLGMPELYTETNREDPKAVLDGVAVAGLVGILRQLGDLSEFAAEVFHGIEEQVLITSARSYKLGERLCNIEAALPSLEKTILAQRSHLHFAYTSGSHWHTQPRIEQTHFIDDDLPLCIMDSYEDCHDPPRLHKLDKYDSSGRGSCFKRYSDPTYFKKASAGPYGIHLQSVTREKKARRSKKKKSFSRQRDNTRDASIFTHVSGTDFTSRNSNMKHSPSQDVSTIHVVPKHQTEPETEDHLTSFDSRNGSSYIECIIRSSYSTQSEENEAKEPSAYLDSTSLHENSGVSDENVENSNLQVNSGLTSSFITWDEKLDIVESTEYEDLSSRVDLIDFDFRDERLVISVVFEDQPDEIESEIDYNNLDPLNIIESESETDAYCKTKSMCSPNPKQITHESHIEAHTFSNNQTETSHQIACTSSISSTSSADDFKSEKGEIYGSNGVFSSSREPNSQPLLSTSGAFWTNGGLLGLAPSKPPDSEYNLIQKDAIKHDEHDAEADMVRNGSKLESSSRYPDSNGLNHVQEHVFNASNTTPDETVSKANKISSSRIFEFSNRIISLVGDEKLASPMQSDVPKNPNGKPFEEQFGNGSPSSPPLQHMRISFKPIDGLETCKLKLEFPNESIGTCCSFQLVPESAILLHKSGLDSEDDDDDDTFFRSSPYASESYSEKWDSDDSPRITSYELVDAFGRISSAESVSNGGHESGFTEIPNFDSLKASLKPHPDVTIDKEDTWGPLKPDCFVGTVDCFSNHKELDVQK